MAELSKSREEYLKEDVKRIEQDLKNENLTEVQREAMERELKFSKIALGSTPESVGVEVSQSDMRNQKQETKKDNADLTNKQKAVEVGVSPELFKKMQDPEFKKYLEEYNKRVRSQNLRAEQIEKGLVTPKKEYEDSIKGKIEKARDDTGKFIREKVTYKLIPPIPKAEERRKKFEEYYKWEEARNKTDVELALQATIPQTFPPKEVGIPLAMFHSEQIKQVRENPEKILAVFGASLLLPKVFSLTGKALQVQKIPSISIAGQSVKSAEGAIKYGLPIFYTSTVTKRVLETEGDVSMKASTLGEITATEVIPAVVGGYTGSKLWQKTEGIFTRLGRKKVPVEDLVIKEATETNPYGYFGRGLTSEQRTSYLEKAFKEESIRLPGQKEPAIFHATGEKFSIKFIKPGRSEFKGLYGSYGIIPHYLRVGSETVYGGSLFEPYASPKLIVVKPKGFVKGKSASPGFAFIPGTTEPEAIIPYTEPETKLIEWNIGKKFFTVYKGSTVAVETLEVATTSTESSKEVSNIFLDSSSLKGSYPSLTPGSLFSLFYGEKSSGSSSLKRFSFKEIIIEERGGKKQGESRLKLHSSESSFIFGESGSGKVIKTGNENLIEVEKEQRKENRKQRYGFQNLSRINLINPPSLEERIASEKKIKIVIPETRNLKKQNYNIRIRKSSKGYDVFVRKRGKFYKVSKYPLTRKSALGLGSQIVGGTPSATFKLERSKGEGQTGKKLRFDFGKFRKKGNLYIEKNKYRINTPGEVAGIPRKAQRLRRSKKWTLSI